ncbi:MAG: glycosyltransferase family 2 protein, partial [Pseudoclavibacter sp.]
LASFLLTRGETVALPVAPVSPDTCGASGPITLAAVRERLMLEVEARREREAALLPSRGVETAPDAVGAPDARVSDARAEPALGAVTGSDTELARTLEAFDAGEARPLVSVVLPTWNRAHLLADAIASVHAQTYENWQLIIADDGSVDDTEHVLAAEAARDARITVLRLVHEGVSAARNAALRAATGEYVAFLDSDKRWDREFLRTMVGYLHVSGAEVAYSVTAVTLRGKTIVTSIPATRASLRVSNSVDQTALVATRELIERVGGFDTSLRRAVDYDLILALSERVELAMVPFVGVRYTEDDHDPNRISEFESVAWNYHVRDRHLWAEHEPTSLETGLVTIIVDGVEAATELEAQLADLAIVAGSVPHEIILVTANDEWPVVRAVALARLSRDDVRVVHAVAGGSRPLYVNRALRRARGEHVLLVSGGHLGTDANLAAMRERLVESGAAALHPVVTDGTHLIHDAGIVYDGSSSDPVRFLAGLPRDWPSWSRDLVATPAAPLPLLLRTETALALRGMTTLTRALWADIDFSRRIAEHAGEVLLDTRSAFQLLRGTGYQPTARAEADVR